MNRTTLFIVCACWLAACAEPTAPPPAVAPTHPPSVLLGEAELICVMHADKNGEQKLVLAEGGGLEFDAVVAPMIDGTASLQGSRKGGVYRFTSHLAEPAKGTLSGVGEVTVIEMDTKVSVALEGYTQSKGPGTPLTFSSPDMSRRGIYVEFAGIAEDPRGQRYSFKVNLGSTKAGSGRVVPGNANYETPMMAKSVRIEAPMTTVVQTTVAVTTSVQQLP